MSRLLVLGRAVIVIAFSQILVGLISVVLSWPVQTASAVPINYQESVSGDLPESGMPLPTLAFDIGLNTVSGRFGRNESYGDDFDSFAFTIPPGSQLSAGRVDLVDTEYGDFVSSGWQLNTGSASGFVRE